MLQLKKYITTPFKIDPNIFVICKTIKIGIPIKRNQNTYKGDNINTHKGDKQKHHKGDNTMKTK